MVEERAVFDCGDSKTPDGAGALAVRSGARNRSGSSSHPNEAPASSCALSRARARLWSAREAFGLDAVAIPLFRDRADCLGRPPTQGSFEGLLLTSANAVRHGGDQLERLRGLPVYVVGEATAEAARAAGLRYCIPRRSGS